MVSISVQRMSIAISISIPGKEHPVVNEEPSITILTMYVDSSSQIESTYSHYIDLWNSMQGDVKAFFNALTAQPG